MASIVFPCSERDFIGWQNTTMPQVLVDAYDAGSATGKGGISATRERADDIIDFLCCPLDVIVAI